MRTTTMATRTGRSWRSRRRIIAWSAPGILVLATLAVGQQFEIGRSTIDGGGAMQSQGGAFEVSGTAGQPDAAMLFGGSFEVNCGFWFPVVPTDCNEDGVVSGSDVAAFLLCMSGPRGLPRTACRCFDTDQDGGVDLRDFASMQIEFHGN